MSTSKTLSRRTESTPEHVHQRHVVAPRVDVYENQDELLLVADLPGAAKDTIGVHVDKGQLTIEARRPDHEAPGALLAGEYERRDYERVFTMPQGIDGSKIDAQFSAGVLRVRLPKSDALRPRRIDVKAS